MDAAEASPRWASKSSSCIGVKQCALTKAVRCESCTAFTGDVLVVESEQDTVVPHQVVVNYREACISARSLTYRVHYAALITR